MKCPICKKERDEDSEHFPFCSRLCKDVDLYHWLNGDYCIYEELPQENEEN